MKPAKMYATVLRRLKRSRGFGVHSPFAFHFIRTTLCYKGHYYAYEKLEYARKVAQELANELPEHRSMMTEKEAQMLFRIACRFHPKSVFQIGDRYGISATAMMLADSRCHFTCALTDSTDKAIFANVTDEWSANITYTSRPLSEELKEYATKDEGLLLIAVCNIDSDLASCIESLRTLASTRECVIIVQNLTRRAAQTRPLWETLQSSARYGMTFTNGNLGIFAALRHLPVQHFNLWF